MTNEQQPNEPPLNPDKVLVIWLILQTLLIAGLVIGLNWAKEKNIEIDLPFNSLFLKAQNPPIDYLQFEEEMYILSQAPPFLITGEVYGTLIECLIHHESGGNQWATGKAGEKGILQFMPRTFREFCVKKYNFQNNIWSVEIQRACCDKMLAEGKAYLWTTIKYCD